MPTRTTSLTPARSGRRRDWPTVEQALPDRRPESTHDHQPSPPPPSSGAPPTHSARPPALRWAVSDTLTITKRNLMALHPDPRGAVLLDRAADHVRAAVPLRLRRGHPTGPGTSYVNYLMPGIFVQTVAFGAVSTSIGLAEDLQKGLIERFRALPMARSAVLTGRTTADLVPQRLRGHHHHRRRLRRRVPPHHRRLALPGRHRAHPAVRLRPVVGLRRHRAVRPEQPRRPRSCRSPSSSR